MPLELELQEVMSHLAQGLGTELGSYARCAHLTAEPSLQSFHRQSCKHACVYEYKTSRKDTAGC